MKTYLMADPLRYPRMTTEEIRTSFLIGDLFEPGAVGLAYVDLDRAVVGIAAPVDAPLVLPTPSALRASFFTERRELGVLNIGGSGTVYLGDTPHRLRNLDLVYIGRGNPEVRFESESDRDPAVFYLLSYPAHAACPVTVVTKEDAQPAEIGSVETCNRRTIYKYIHMGGCPQLPTRDPSSPWKQLEHDACTYPHASVGGLSLLRCPAGRARRSPDGPPR
jgi:4-deoxy-L-threo-5-hexosulose-uronate ketol-isomerase